MILRVLRFAGGNGPMPAGKTAKHFQEETMDRRDLWMKDPELKAAYEALGPKFRREVEMAQQRREQRGAHAVAVSSRNPARQVTVARR